MTRVPYAQHRADRLRTQALHQAYGSGAGHGRRGSFIESETDAESHASFSTHLSGSSYLTHTSSPALHVRQGSFGSNSGYGHGYSQGYGSDSSYRLGNIAPIPDYTGRQGATASSPSSQLHPGQESDVRYRQQQQFRDRTYSHASSLAPSPDAPIPSRHGPSHGSSSSSSYQHIPSSRNLGRDRDRDRDREQSLHHPSPIRLSPSLTPSLDRSAASIHYPYPKQRKVRTTSSTSHITETDADREARAKLRVERRAAREKRKLDRAGKSTLTGDQFHSPLREMLRYGARKGWEVGLLGWGLAVIGVSRIAVLMGAIKGNEVVHPLYSFLARYLQAVLPITLRSTRSGPALAAALVEITALWPIVIMWAVHEGRRTGRSWRSQVTAVLSVLSSPGVIRITADISSLASTSVALAFAVLYLLRKGKLHLAVLTVAFSSSVRGMDLTRAWFLGSAAWTLAQTTVQTSSIPSLLRQLSGLVSATLLGVILGSGTLTFDKSPLLSFPKTWTSPAFLSPASVLELVDILDLRFALGVLACTPAILILLRTAYALRPASTTTSRSKHAKQASPSGRVEVTDHDSRVSVPSIQEPAGSTAQAPQSSIPHPALTNVALSRLYDLFPLVFLITTISAAPLFGIETRLTASHIPPLIIPTIPMSVLMAYRGRPARSAVQGKEKEDVDDEAWEMGSLAQIVTCAISFQHDPRGSSILIGTIALIFAPVLGYRLTLARRSTISRYMSATILVICALSTVITAAMHLRPELGVMRIRGIARYAGLMSGWTTWAWAYIWAMRKLVLNAWALGGLG